MTDRMDFLTRRRFLVALAASAVAAGAPLPVGYPAEKLSLKFAVEPEEGLCTLAGFWDGAWHDLATKTRAEWDIDPEFECTLPAEAEDGWNVSLRLTMVS